ncbi:hypothetical protein AB670_00042 [Chryseobacterium sp. MOF25P]|uniref:hypothetical protein n=1 Tax=unclassified Chryseobacterium TaxID=2593645 RepID=UPI000804F323|nr:MULTISPECIES: hypothetical protein [unclassified Chryseobacterium]OBW43513.1 hypothetical protein AB670_00042 [Chryseobacterium sp. MOF25P]OBW46713.1 hypothetical protein AB671_01209 [Chryseobacterium sp. BGARF1]
MKKLFTLALIGVFSTLLTSCSNTGTADSFPEETNQIKQSEMKASAKESGSASLEEAILVTSKDENLVAINHETLQLVHRGELLKESDFENNIVLNPEIERKVKTVCKATDSNGYTVSIVHVYDNHYSGYQLVTTSPRGFSSSSSINYFPTDCLSVWSMGWF